jgi:hypothetical protein
MARRLQWRGRPGLAHAVAPAVLGAEANGGEAVGGAGGDGPGATPAVDAHRPAMRVSWGRWLGVAEDVVEQGHQGPESLGGSLEHMFVRVDGGSDGS